MARAIRNRWGAKVKFGESRRPAPRLVREGERRVLPLWPERWQVLFGDRQHPLWLPPADYRFQKRCLRFFISNPYKALYARALLGVNALFPRAGVVPELRLPRAMLAPLAYMRKYGVFEVESDAYNKHEVAIGTDKLAGARVDPQSQLVTRGTNGSNPASAATARRSFSPRAGASG